MKKNSLYDKEKGSSGAEYSFECRDREPVSLCIEIKGCHPQLLHSEQRAKSFILRLCNMLEMQRFGECVVLFFSRPKEMASGYSAVQFCQEALITAHFVGFKQEVYLNIFSFSKIPPHKCRALAIWCKELLRGETIKIK